MGEANVSNNIESKRRTSIITAPIEFNRIRINKWRVRDGYPVSSSQVILLYEVLDGLCDDEKVGLSKNLQKFKVSKNGFVKKRFVQEGEIIQNGAALLELTDCIHTTVIKDMCADCGADLRQNEDMHEALVPMVHCIPELKVTQKLAQKLGHDDTRRLLEDRKLVLLVDLDQTVIHTTNDNVPNNIKGIHHFQLYGPHSPWYHTRLRPGTANFLETMTQLYELHICTFGARNYAHTIANILDYDGKYFSNRILSRDECFNATSKTDNLRALFPNGDSMVCIIDDREDVWNMASNLIQVKPYHFFQHTGDINAPPGLSKHELDGEGVDFHDLKKPDEEDGEEEAEDTQESLKPSSKENDEIKPENDQEILEVSEVVPLTEDTSDDSQDKKASEDDSSSKTSDEKENGKILVEKDEEFLKPCSPKKMKISSEMVLVPIDDDADDPKPGTSKKLYKVKDETDGEKTSKKKKPNKNDKEKSPKLKVKGDNEDDIEIEIEDPDDYLLYLEVILKNIHARFYKIYDETNEIPDLKIIVPKIRSEVLKGLNLVFSGLVPTNMKLEHSRAYFIAKSLGANVTQNIDDDTTHVVAVTTGTFKVIAAKKNPNIKIVNANWLWSCAERWEHVDELLYPLDRKMRNKQRHPPAHCHSPEHYINYNDKSEISPSSSAQQQYALGPMKFIDTINPLLSFSNADLADMNNEFEQFFQSDDSSSEDEHVNIENPPVDKTLRKRKREEKEEDRAREFFSRVEGGNLLEEENENENDLDLNCDGPEAGVDDGENNRNPNPNESTSSDEKDDDEKDDDDEMPSEKFRRGEDLPSDMEMDSNSNSNDSGGNEDTTDDGEWNMMGAALEREFLGLEE